MILLRKMKRAITCRRLAIFHVDFQQRWPAKTWGEIGVPIGRVGVNLFGLSSSLICGRISLTSAQSTRPCLLIHRANDNTGLVPNKRKMNRSILLKGILSPRAYYYCLGDFSSTAGTHWGYKSLASLAILSSIDIQDPVTSSVSTSGG